MQLLQKLVWLIIYCAGTSADIHYGTGAISGFFSQDSVKVGHLIVENQVISLSHTVNLL